MNNMPFSKRTIKDFFVYGFAAYGALWVLIEPLGSFLEDNKPEGFAWYSALVIVSILVGLWRCRPRCRISLKIPASDSFLEVKFGDIFKEKGVIVIPVNEYFDGCLGDHVSEKSLHGLFIKNVLGGQSQSFYSLTESALRSIEAEQVQRYSGREKKYPIGTVACVDVNNERYLLTALSHTNIDTLKAFATVHELWDCLYGTWQGARDFSNGNRINIPLMGSGLSGVGLPPKNLVEILLTSFLYCTKQQKVADHVTLILHPRMKKEIDLEAIRRGWE